MAEVTETMAKEVCSGCIVRAQCLDEALRLNEVGIWGGTNDRERRVIKRRYVRSRKALATQTAAM